MTESSDWDIDDNQGEKPLAPKALREAYEKQKAENDALAKQLKDLAGKVRNAELEKKFASKGLPDKAIGLFPKDVDPTDEEVSKWIEQYGGLFGSSSDQAAEPSPEPKQEVRQADENYIMASQFEQMQKVSQSAPPVGPKNNLETMLQNPHLQDEVPFEEFLAAMRGAGAKV